MKHRVKKFASLALAFAMLGSSVFSGGVSSVFASTSDSDDDIVISSEYQTNDDEIEIADVEEKAGASVSIADLGIEADGIDIEVENIYKAGDAVSLQVNAFNNQEKDSVLRVYFWDYAEKLPDDTEEWNRLLNVPCTDIGISNLDEASQITVALNSETEEISEKAAFVQKMDEDRVSACYLEVSLLSGFNVDFVLDVYTEMAQTVTVVPVIVTAGEERCFEPEIISWESEDADISIEAETEAEAETEVEIESEDDQIVIESETPADTFASVYLGDTVKTDGLNASDFASMRLILLTDDADVIVDKSDVIGQYDNIYLLEFTSIQQTMNAYVYYKDKVSAVEPDKVVETAESEDEDITVVSETPVDIDSEINPIDALNEVGASEDVQDCDRVIALIDTGAAECKNVIDRVSVIDDVLSGTNSHADAMVRAIIGQNEDANILSIRAMNDEGYGTVSSLVAAMEYAMEQDVSIINLSLYGKATLSASVLRHEILKAVDAGIIVVGAAGNDGADVADYIPGSVTEAYIIGACDKEGNRLESSNYGSTVDYNVVASSTSEAAAKFSGYLSANELNGIAINEGVIYATNYVSVESDADDRVEIETDTEEDLLGDDEVYYFTEDTDYSKIARKNYRDIDWGKYGNNGILDEGTNEYLQNLGIDAETEENYGSILENEYAFMVASELDDWAVGTVHSGMCSISYSYQSGSQSYFGLTNFSGGLEGCEMIGEGWCADHTAAEPPAGHPIISATAVVTSVDKSSGWVYLSLLVTPDGVTDGVTGNQWGLIGYQHIAANIRIKKNFEGTAKLKKVSALPSITNGNNYYSLAGAYYGIWKNKECTQGTGLSFTTDANGNANLNGSLPAGTYYVREITPSKGYELDTTVYPVTIVAGQTATVNIANGGTVKENPKKGYAKLQKVSALPTMTDGNNCYTLSDAKYGVYTSEANAKADTSRVATLTTDSSGNSNTVTLNPGTYYVKEVSASKGFELDETVHKVVVKSEETSTITSTEYPGNDPTGIQITKIWNGNETPTIPTLEGTQFTIKYYDGYYTKSTLPSKATRTWVIEVKKASNGMYIAMLGSTYIVSGLSDKLYYDGNKVVLPYGTITIQETKPAAGYTLKGYLMDSNGNTISTDSELYVSQVTKEGGMVKLNGGNEYSASDTPIYGSIKIKKYDTDGKTALQGVTFKIVNSAGKTVATKTTDKNGEILFDDLYPDVYTITETATVSGHTLLKDPIVAEVPMRVTEQDIKDNNIDKNQCIYDAADDIYYIYNLTYEVGNSATFEYPMTGGMTTARTFLPLIAGLMVLAGMSAVLLRKKKRA